jgi:membrane associated rhomboid family serine protease
MTAASVGFHCPECARGGRQKVYTAQTLHRLNRPWATLALIAVNCAVYVVGLGQSQNDALAGRGGLAVDGGLFGPAVAAGDWYRIFTSGFLHAGLLHLGFNMYILYQLGLLLEPALGRTRFTILYLTALVTGSLGVLLLDPNALTVGASGAVFGLMGAAAVGLRSRGVNVWQTGIGSLLAINLLLTFAIPGISIGGHLGGLAGGTVAGLAMFEGTDRLQGNAVVTTALVVVMGVAAYLACLSVA